MSTSADVPAQTDPHHTRIGARRLLAMAEFRRLLFSRFSSQWGDGLFQTGLAGAVVFNPERAVSPAEIAAGFVVLLLPYSIIGPFAGALLDRWDRRRVLVAANLLRGTLIVVAAVCVATGVAGFPLLLLALVVIGISRFVGAGLSASLPHVVPVPNLVEANALSVTLGAVVSVIGAGCAVGLRAVFGEGDVGSGLTTAVAVVGSVLAALARQPVRPRRARAGPGGRAGHRARGRGQRPVRRRPGRAAHADRGRRVLRAARAPGGVRRLAAADRDADALQLRGLGTDRGRAARARRGARRRRARHLPRRAHHRTPGHRASAASGRCSSRSASPRVTQFGLGLPMLLPTTLVAAFLIAYTGQVVKLCVDAAVQRDIGDETRGRVFALYDMLFNITQALAVAIAATVIPANGESVALIVAATVVYLAGIAGFELVSRRSQPVRPAA